MSRPSSPVTPPAPAELARRWLWMPLGVFALGVGSLALLVGSHWTRERLITAELELVRSAGEIRTQVAIAHLWVEEHVSGDAVDLAEISGNLDHATAALDRMLAPRSATPYDVELRALARSAREHLATFSRLTVERRSGFASGGDVGIGSAIDIEYDRVFRLLLTELGRLESRLKRRLESAEDRASLLFRAMVFAWIAIVALAVGGLWSRERHRKEVALALERSQGQLLSAQKMEAVGRLAGGLAHDINNYLAAITAQCELEHMKAEPDSRTARRMEAVLGTVESASSLIQRLLAFSRRQPAHPEATDVGRVVRRLETMVTRLLGEDIRLRTRLPEQPAWVIIDRAQLEQIVLNLVVNAREAMPTGGELSIELETTPGHEVCLIVRDSGKGIDPAMRSRIFEPFFSTKDKSANSGLGLSTVLGIAEQNAGRVEVDSRPGKGAEFRVVFPATTEPPAAAVEDAGERRAETGGSGRILLAEDNEDLGASLRDLLRELGYEVVRARDGREALELYDHDRGGFDLVISDVVMPDVGGRQLADALRTRHPEVRLLFISGQTDSVVLRHGIATGEVDFLPKPFSSASLGAKVRQVLERPRTIGRGRTS